MPNITSRRFAERDKRELNDLWCLVARRSRTIKKFEWEWLDTPEGWGSMWLLVDNDTGKIIGHHGLIPIKFSICGRTILAGKTENNVMHPQYRGKGIFYPFEVKFHEESRERFQLLFTTAGVTEAGTIRLKLGYTAVGGYTHYIKATNRSHLNTAFTNIIAKRALNKLMTTMLISASRLASLALMPVFSKKVPTDEAIKLEKVHTIETVADKLDRFWERNKDKFGITPDRNSRYLKWRIFDNPNVNYEFFLAIRHGDIVGYLITKTNEELLGVRAVVISDIVAAGNNDLIFNSILHRATKIFKERGIHLIYFTTLSSDNFINRAMLRNGFVPLSRLRKLVPDFFVKKAQESRLMAKALDESVDQSKVSNPACWYFTELLMEGIR
jgi:hypothetical protein